MVMPTTHLFTAEASRAAQATTEAIIDQVPIDLIRGDGITNREIIRISRSSVLGDS
jgi:hypothetical protein